MAIQNRKGVYIARPEIATQTGVRNQKRAGKDTVVSAKETYLTRVH